MGYIFISYSHKDKEFVHKLHHDLENEGFEVWIDDRIDFGDEWPMVIQKKLDACDAFILVASDNAYQSKWVQKEVTRAQRINKPFFPILLQGDTWLSIESTQYADVRENKSLTDDFYNRLSECAERKYSETLHEVWITEDWLSCVNDKYKFMFRYPSEGKIKIQSDSHVRIDLPRLEGTNLREKYLTIDSVESEDCAPLTKKWLPDMADAVQKRKVIINNLVFLKESDGEGAAGSYLECVSYSISRPNLCVSIAINLLFSAHGNYYPLLIPRLDRDAEIMIATLVANTFTWLDL
ncbi:MAG TPA: toll/interleukin-1 receptor domain-containing protein [Anaerolineales bacterium]|nr:toll/interleukin-1 receptor domain-containing protein [Anaerolineales bacterium]